MFDLELNETLRSRKGDKAYFTPVEGLLTYWLVAYMGKPKVRVSQVLAEFKASRKRTLH